MADLCGFAPALVENGRLWHLFRLFVRGHNPAEAQGDAKVGQQKAEAVCAVCHGVDGLAKIPEAPNLAGQNESYLVGQLTAFKPGERKNEKMSIVSQSLSDAAMANLAAYYSTIQISLRKTSAQ